jgi:hypothetical protein
MHMAAAIATNLCKVLCGVSDAIQEGHTLCLHCAQFCLFVSCRAPSQLKTLGYCRPSELLSEEDGRRGVQAALHVAEKLYAAYGLVHKDFRWHNLLWAEAAAKPFIIDFELATKSGQKVPLPNSLPHAVQSHTR